QQSAIVMDRIGRVLEGCGAGFGDVIKINNYYVGGGTEADWEGAARVRARYFAEPGPAATGMPVPRHRRPGLLAKTEVIAMRGSAGESLPRRHSWPEGHWDWPIHLPYKHGIACGDLIAVGGQVSLDPRGLVIAPGDIRRQTMTALDNIERVLAELDATLDHVVKITAFYKAGGRELHSEICDLVARRFAAPGPARTFVPLPYLAYEGMDVEIEAIAMIGHRLGG